MFILTNYIPETGMSEIVDTKDGVRDIVHVSTIADMMRKKPDFKVYGFRRGLVYSGNVYPIPGLNITVCYDDANKALQSYAKKLQRRA